MTDEPKIVTHAEPVGRAKTNYIARIAVDKPPSGNYEQIWTNTEDQRVFELCCIPLFPYGLSLGDRITIAEDGSFEVVAKSGHRTIRVVINDEAYAHERHAEFHDLIAQTGVLWERHGHASTYWAFDVDSDEQAQRLIDVLTPLSAARTVDWEWADPPLDA